MPTPLDRLATMRCITQVTIEVDFEEMKNQLLEENTSGEHHRFRPRGLLAGSSQFVLPNASGTHLPTLAQRRLCGGHGQSIHSRLAIG